MKPYIYIANVSEDQLNEASVTEKQLRKFAFQEGVEVIPICAKVESELSDMDEEESDYFMEELGIDGTGIDQLTNSGYRMLEQITILLQVKMKSEHGKSGKVLLLRKLQEKYILTLKKASSGQKYFILTTLTV